MPAKAALSHSSFWDVVPQSIVFPNPNVKRRVKREVVLYYSFFHPTSLV